VERALAVVGALGQVFVLQHGAQGGKAEDIRDYLKDGNGGVVNSSRGILLAWEKPEFSHLSFAQAARAETIRMREDIRNAI